MQGGQSFLCPRETGLSTPCPTVAIVLWTIATCTTDDVGHFGFVRWEVVLIDLEFALCLELLALEGGFFAVYKQWKVGDLRRFGRQRLESALVRRWESASKTLASLLGPRVLVGLSENLLPGAVQSIARFLPAGKPL
jgi:hypothetical protein